MILRCLITFLIVVFINHILYSQQVNKVGIPLITNYTPKQYKSHNENWMSVVNKYGILYFANTSGSVIEYDGKNWNLIPTKLKLVIYSLACDSNGIVYYGGGGGFGCIKPDYSGSLRDYSLVNSNIESSVQKQTFWKIFVGKNQEVYFCSRTNVYVYEKNKVKTLNLPKNSWLSFYINGLLYTSNSDSGLLVLDKDKFIKVKNFEFFKNKDIQVIEELNSKTWLIFSNGKFYKYNLESKKISEIDENLFLWSYLSNNFLYHSYNKNNLGIWASIYGGIAITTDKWKNKYILNDSLGLTSSQVSSVNYCHIDGTIWVTTLNGISKVEFENPIRSFGLNQSLKGNVYNIKRFKGKLFVATGSGLFVLENKTYNSSFKRIDFFKENLVSSIEVVNFKDQEKLWIASQRALFEFDGKEFKNISDGKNFIVECLLQSKSKQDVYIGTQNGLYKCTYRQKYRIEKIHNINDFITSIIEDEHENIWFSTTSNGVYSLSKEGILKHHTKSDGLPVLENIFLNYYKKNVLFCTQQGLYYFNSSNNKIEKCTILGSWLNEKNIISSYKGFNNQMWFNIGNKLYLLNSSFNNYDVDSITFKRLPESAIYHVYSEPTGITWIGTNEGLFSYDSKKKTPNSKFYALIRNVSVSSANKDSVIFYGTYYHPLKKVSFVQDNNYNRYVLEYKYNALTFTFAAPYFQDESKIEFSYILEGFDKNWSNWTKENKVNYTNLPEGKYTFKVKARNIYFQKSEVASFTFEIKPPWYRTKWAYFAYVLITILVFIFSIKLYTRKLEADKRRLEKIVEERTAEVVKQKNEIEIKNKVIEQKNKDITDSIYYAKRIQEAILPPKEYVRGTGVDMFIYFRPKDIVSGDFYFIRNIVQAKILIVVAADCTGHGVPGAFMSMLGYSLLNELVTKPEINHTDLVLNELRKAVIRSLNPEGKEFETRDGMDISLIAYNYETNKLEFSCANNPLYLIRNNELIEYKADKMPIGLYELKQELFSRNEIQIMKDDIIYLFSDGFPDQFGGETGKKYMYKRFKEFLLSIHHLPLNEQENFIEQEIIRWRGELEQIDDQIVIGIKFKTVVE